MNIYLKNEVKSDFIKKLDKNIQIIKDQPQSFPESDKKPGLRKCVITKHITLYYEFDERAIYILSIFDTRQDPGKVNKEL